MIPQGLKLETVDGETNSHAVKGHGMIYIPLGSYQLGNDKYETSFMAATWLGAICQVIYDTRRERR
jgi:hypothetical protein